MNHEEDNEQITLLRWTIFASGKYPELRLLFHIPNGGLRGKAEAARFKAMGVKSGVPDLFLPVARSGAHGLFIEMKASGGRVSPNQKEWISELEKQGYSAAVCFGWDEARGVLEKYLKGETND